MKKEYEFLNQINFPSDLKKVPESKLQKVANELREEMINAVSVTGGHLGASLGVVELTVAIHYIFNSEHNNNNNLSNKKIARLIIITKTELSWAWELSDLGQWAGRMLATYWQGAFRYLVLTQIQPHRKC